MGSLAIILGVILIQMLSGAMWWLIIRSGQRVSVYEVVGIGLALGTFASMLMAMILAGTPLASVAWALPAVGTGALVWLPVRSRRLDLTRITVPRAQSWAVVVTCFSGLLILSVNWVRIPLTAPTTSSFSDLYFFEAISRGLAEFGPSQSILMEGGALRYHWFTYAWSGELAQIAHAEPFLVLTRVLPVVSLVGVSLLAISWAARLTHVRWVPLLSGLLVVSGGYSGALYGTILNFDSPSQSFTTMWLLAFAIAYLTAVQGCRYWLVSLITTAALAAALTGGKVSHAVVAVGGVVLITTVLIVRRDSRWRRAVVVTGVTGVSMLITYALVLYGVAVNRNLTEAVAVKASTWQGLDPFVGQLGILLGTLALLAAIGARLAGMMWSRKRGERLPLDWWFALGGITLGIVAIVMLREGINELWFILAASAPASVISARGVGLGAAWLHEHQAHRTTLHRAAPVLIAVPASVVCLVLSLNWPQHQSILNWLSPVSIWVLTPLISIPVAMFAFRRGQIIRACVALTICALPLTSILTRPETLWTSQRKVTTEIGAITPDGSGHKNESIGSTLSRAQPVVMAGAQAFSAQRDAATWVDSNVPRNAVLATTNPVSALVPALTGRQMFVAGNTYQVGLGAASDIDTVFARSAASLAFTAGPDRHALDLLCSAGGRWIWATSTVSPSWNGLADVVFLNDQVSILKLRPEACSA